MTPDAEITEIDRMAYIDGQLDDPRRLDVEMNLAADPLAAARLMEDLAQRTALRLAVRGTDVRPSATLESLTKADRPATISRAMPWRRFGAIAALIVAGALLGLSPDARQVTRLIAGQPDYLDDAVQSREASLVRTSMASRPPTPWMKPSDIRAAIRIRLPVMPQGWRLVDVQVFPSDTGPSAQLLIDTGVNGQVSLYSSLTRGQDTVTPVVVDRFGETMAFWEIDGQSFVMIGDQPRGDLRAMALDLSDNQMV